MPCPTYQPQVLHPQDFQHYLTTLHQPRVCVCWPSGQLQAFLFCPLFDFRALLGPFLGLRWVSCQCFGSSEPWEVAKINNDIINFLIW